MKKIISVVCALAVAATLSVTAFAATPSEIYGDPAATTSEGLANTIDVVSDKLADSVRTGNVDVPLADYLCSLITASNDRVSLEDSMTMGAALKALAAKDSSMAATASVTQGSSITTITYKANTALASASVDVSNKVVTLEASYVGNVQSEMGAFVTIRVPKNAVDLTKGYTWSCDGKNGDVMMDQTSEDDYVTFSFYAPHFSTYVLTPSSTASTTTNNPIKATGADMSLSMMALALGGIAVIGGAAVATKKFNLGK